MVALLAAIAAFVAVAAGFMGVMASRNNQVDQRFGRLARRNVRTSEPSFFDRALQPLAGRFSGAAGQVLPASFSERLEARLDGAGWRLSPSQFLTLLATLAAIAFMLPIGLSILSAGRVTTIAILAALFLAVASIILPIFFMRSVARQRQAAIWKSLPDACDLITLCVEAGLGLDGALRLVSQKLKGPLAEEIGQALREIGLGRPRRDALLAMAERADVTELITFVQSLIQTDQLGTSLGSVLRSQAIGLRAHRRRKAQELVLKAPVKMAFPLVLFTMPSFFIIAIGPIAVRLINYLND